MPVRKTYPGQFKGHVAVAAVKAEHTLSELAAPYEVHPNQIKHWKSYLLEHVGELFEDQPRQKDKDKDAMLDELYNSCYAPLTPGPSLLKERGELSRAPSFPLSSLKRGGRG